jgi:plastocyanin
MKKIKKNKKIFIIAAFCLTAIAIFSLASCTVQDKSSATTKQDSSSVSESNPNQVICKNNKFNPDTLTIKVGTTVVWVNQDSYIHTVTSGTSPNDRSGLFDSGNLNGGDTFSFTFDTAGTYDYFCIPHYSMGMIGKIIVTE